MTMNPRTRQFTAAEFWRMYDLGFFNDQRVELIGGEIVTKLTQSNWHAIGLDLMRDALAAAFGPNYWVRVQNSLDLSPLSVPDPDIAVTIGSARQQRGQRANPTSALLVVEVSDTTLATDRERKASLYAASGIADYWILNIADNTLEVRRDPRPDATQDFGFGYASLTTLTAVDFATPLAAPNARISVADLLPV
jgi:Uma2 family endonuclease